MFLPVHWLFFAASTYVWVQFVWHTGNSIEIIFSRLGPIEAGILAISWIHKTKIFSVYISSGRLVVDQIRTSNSVNLPKNFILPAIEFRLLVKKTTVKYLTILWSNNGLFWYFQTVVYAYQRLAYGYCLSMWKRQFVFASSKICLFI